jgi:hypothetical protein
MTATVNRESQAKLAKLLAKENIQVAIGNYTTAFFDVKNRILGLPTWNTTNKYVSDLLIGHEVGHALHTPEDAISRFKAELPGVPFDIGNIVEDIRIERLIKSNYPGLVYSFKEGYSHFVKNDFFKVNGTDLATFGFADRLNIHAKIGEFVDVPLNNAERDIYNRCYTAVTFDDVLDICKDIAKMIKEEPQQQPQKQKGKSDPNAEKSPSAGNDSTDQKSEGDAQKSEGDAQKSEGDAQKSEKTDNADSKDNSDSKNGSNSDDPSSNGKDSTHSESATESKQPSSEETAKKPGSESKDGGGNIANNETLSKELESHTMKSVDENIKALQDDDNTCFVANPPYLKDMLSTIIPIEEVMRDRRETNPVNYNTILNSTVFTTEWKTFKSHTEKSISSLVKEFERRKAAYQYSRSKQSRTGSIDVNRLYSYKYEDQIFKSVTSLADAKSHGMIFFIDYSGSMQGTIGRVIDQTLQLVYFCKAVAIPFEVYGFTTTDEFYGIDPSRAVECKLPGYNMNFTDVKIINVLSSKLNKNNFDLACRELRAQCPQYHRLVTQAYHGGRFPLGGAHERFSGTPLVETVIVAHEIVKKFKREYPIQKLNVIFLTDGDERPVNFSKNSLGEKYEKPVKADIISPNIKITIEGKTLEFRRRMSRNMYAEVVNNLKTTLGVTTIGFFIANYRSDYSKHCIAAIQNSGKHKDITWTDACAKFKTIQRAAKKDKCISIDNGFNFDSYFVFESKNDLEIDDDSEFEIGDFEDSTATSSQNKIARAFTKYTSEKRLSRVFLNKFTQTIA